MSEEAKREDAEHKIIRDAANTLSEHFDTVQIFVTRYEAGTDKGDTMNWQVGIGNWFARYGVIRNYLIREDEETRMQARQDDPL